VDGIGCIWSVLSVVFSVPVCGEEGIYCVYVLSVGLLIIKYDAESIPDSSDC